MGFFSQGNYGTVNYLENVQADPSYCNNNGIYRSLVEGYENDRIMFEHMLEYDFKESALIHEGSSDQIELLQENVFTSFFSKIKELFKKLWAKIKAVFHGFIAKFSAKLGSENKAFAKKYRREIFGKNLSKFEAKYEKPKADIGDLLSLASAKNSVSIEVEKSEIDRAKSLVEDWDEEDEESDALFQLTGIDDIDAKDFNKEYHEACFEDKETIEGSNEVEAALTHLEGADKTISNVKKASDKIQRCLEDCIKKVDKMEKDYYKNMKFKKGKYGDYYIGAGDVYTTVKYDISDSRKASLDTSSKKGYLGGVILTDSKEKAQSVINLLSKRVNVCKNAFNKVSAACLKEAKFYIAQDRMLVAKAVAYRPKNESTELVSQGEMDFFGDIAAWEVETDLR